MRSIMRIRLVVVDEKKGQLLGSAAVARPYRASRFRSTEKRLGGWPRRHRGN